MYVVIEQNQYGHESGYTVGAVYGPYEHDQAHGIAEKLNALDHYAVEYSVTELTLSIPAI